MSGDDPTDILYQLRAWLKSGCTIKATDVNAPVLEKGEDGIWIGGLTIDGSTAKPE